MPRSSDAPPGRTNIVDLIDRDVRHLQFTQIDTDLTRITAELTDLVQLRAVLRELEVRSIPCAESTKVQLQALLKSARADTDLSSSLEGTGDKIRDDMNGHLRAAYGAGRNLVEHIAQLQSILRLLKMAPVDTIAIQDIDRFFAELARKRFDQSGFASQLRDYVVKLETQLRKAESELPGTELVKRVVTNGTVPFSDLSEKEVLEILKSPVSRILGIKVIEEKDHSGPS